MGFHVIPDYPRDKMPGEYLGTPGSGRWINMSGWNDYSTRKPFDAMVTRWSTWPDANIGIVMGSPAGDDTVVIGIDYDTDIPHELNELQSVLPDTPMKKKGAKGFTGFYRSVKGAKTRQLKMPAPTSEDPRHMRVMVEVLAGNAPRQSVVPPSIHPVTKERYEWIGKPVRVERLPMLTAAHLQALEDKAVELGCVLDGWSATSGTRGGLTMPTHSNDDASPAQAFWRHINDAALLNFPAWVPYLGLESFHTTGDGGYRAVATWRSSNGGRSTAERNRNLSFHRHGIRDFGDCNYTAIDVVMAARDIPFQEASEWLRVKLGLPLEGESDTEPALRQTVRHHDGTLTDADTGEVLDGANDNRPADGDELPDHLTRPPGLLGDVVDWIVDSARSPSRVLALGSALVVLGTLSGRRDAGPTGAGTSLYVLGIGPSGLGKQHGLDQLQRLMAAAEAADRIGPGEFMSATAVVKHLEDMPLSACPMDEFGAMLKRINSKRAGPHDQGISKMLRQAWGVNYSTMRTPAWAGSASRRISAPCMSIYGVSTPKEFYNSLTGGDVENGTLNRFLVLSTSTRPAKVRPAMDPFAVPAHLATRLGALYVARDRSFPIMEGHDPIIPSIIPWDDGAEAVHDAFECEVQDIRDSDAELEDFYARTVEMGVRLATIVAVGRDLDRPSVSVDDLAWGREIALWSSRKLARDVARYMSETEAGARWSKVTERLRRAGGRLKYLDLVKFMKLDPRDMRSALDGLKEAGLIVVEEETRAGGGAGRPARFVRLTE